MIISKEHIDKFNEYMELKRWGKGTLDTYGLYARQLLNIELNQDNINNMLRKRGNNYPAFIRNFTECFDLNFKIIVPRGRKKRKQVVDHFTQNEINLILENVDRKLSIMIRLMYENGLRVSEVMGLQRKNFDLINGRVKGRGKGNEYFNMPLYDKNKKELELYLRPFEREDYVFHWKNITSQRKKAWEVVKKEIKGILPYKEETEIYPHALRHTCGTLLREQGFDLREIQEVLRHKNLETIKHYTAVDKEKLNIKLKRVFE